MALNLNLCTSVLPKFSFEDAIEIAASAKFHGVELRVHDQNHVSLKQLENEGLSIRRQLDYAGLQVPVLNSYIPVSDQETVEQLIRVSQTMGVPKARVVLPRSCQATVSRQSKMKEIIPSYETFEEPETLFNQLKTTLHSLEHKAEQAGVKLLLELHWGTVMSSFSSAYLLTHNLNPDYIAITFDPANMMVEGKEDWEFGLKLIRSQIANVHVKNVVWESSCNGWSWQWAPVTEGMVDWAELILLLESNHYSGDYAIEDFLVPNTSKAVAIVYLSRLHSEFSQLYKHYSTVAKSQSVAMA
jgi:sugar phosphate isomerase/epimerase